MTNITETVEAIRERARFFVSQRRKDVELYGVLSDCLAACERVDREDLLEELKARYLEKQDESGRNRRYFETTADAALVICRIVFEASDKRRDACWRYTAVLREARKRQIASADFTDWLRRNGGINALFVTRPVQARNVTTRILNLVQPITAPKDRPFSLTLKRCDDGRFDVLQVQA